MNLQKIYRTNLENLLLKAPDPKVISKQFAEHSDWFTAGKIHVPDGKITVGDPFGYIYRDDFSQRLTIQLESGDYPVQIAYIQSEITGINLCTLRLKILDTESVKYEKASSSYEEDIDKPENHFIGFPVKRGYISFISSAGAEKYRNFMGKWIEYNPGKRFYDKFFSFLLDDMDNDEWSGDFIEWKVPDTEYNMIIAASGFGNGFYIPYFGYDSDNHLCEITVPVVDTEFIHSEEQRFREIWDGAEFCIVTNKIALHGFKVGYMYRDEVSRSFSDSGWRFYSGYETGSYEETLSNSSILSVLEIAEHDPSVIPYLKSPYGTALYKNDNGDFEDDEMLINSW